MVRSKLHADGLVNVKYVHIDVTDLATIQAAKETIDQAEGKLDTLVNNAGKFISIDISFTISNKADFQTLIGIGKLNENQNATSLSLAPVREAMETNLFGLIQTTIAFLPLLRKSTNAVILNVSIRMASNAIQARPDASFHVVAYSASKAAANSYTIALAQELKAEGIKVNAVTPGFTSTKLNNYRQGGKSAKAGAEVLLPWALLEKDGPTCKLNFPVLSLRLLIWISQ